MKKAGWQRIFSLTLESSEQMTQDRTFCNPEIMESTKWRLSDMYVVVISCFYSILRLKT